MVPFIICFSGFPEVFYDGFVVFGTQLVAYVSDMVVILKSGPELVVVYIVGSCE